MIPPSCWTLQDPLMRRIEGAPMIPPGGLLQGEGMPMGRGGGVGGGGGGGMGMGMGMIAARRGRLAEWVHNFNFRAKKIDVISRVMFPVVFAIFNVMYWSYYLTQETKRTK